MELDSGLGEEDEEAPEYEDYGEGGSGHDGDGISYKVVWCAYNEVG